jgi:hypothetical protein
VIYFGHDYDEMNLDVTGQYGMCAPVGSLEAPDTGWPADDNTGTTVGFGTPIIGDTFFHFYYFRVDDFSGGAGNPWLCSAINPTGGYAAFFDDSAPSIQDDIDQFGCVVWYGLGHNECPVMGTAAGACCDPLTGECLLLTSADCIPPDFYLGDDTVCVPNPCPVPPPEDLGACCDSSGNCTETNEEGCLPPSYWIPNEPCDPSPCAPPVPTKPTTWGRIKASFR